SNVVGMVNLAPVRSCEVWRSNSMKREHLFCRTFILCQEVGVRSSASVGQLQQVHVGGNVHFFRIIASEGFGQIEYQIGATFFEGMKAFRASVQYLIKRMMAWFFKGFENFLST